MKPSFKDFLLAIDEMEEAIEKGTLMLEEKEVHGLTPEVVRKVYHRDYLKTRNKPYRKYNAQRRARRKGVK